MTEPLPQSPAPAEFERERHATNLELFLDLVFVFAVTQLAGFLSADLTWSGLGRGLLIGWLVWWLWSQFTWLGTAIDLEQRSVTQLLVLAAVPPTLLMAVSLPTAYTTSGLQFAGAYMAVQLWALAIMGWGVWGDPSTRKAWLSFAPLAALAPTLLVVGALFDGRARVAVWAVVAIFDVGAALLGGRPTSSGTAAWRIEPAHFAERHSLFVIISLGEVLVAAGATATGSPLTASIGVGLVTAVSVACVLWWTYFAFVPRVTEAALTRVEGSERGRAARNLFTFGHFPVVIGIVLYAVVAKHLVSNPLETMHAADLAVLTGAVTFFIGGLLGMQWQIVHRLAPERLAVIIMTGAWCAIAGAHLDAVVIVAGVAAMLLVMQAITLRRFNRADMSAATDPK